MSVKWRWDCPSDHTGKIHSIFSPGVLVSTRFVLWKVILSDGTETGLYKLNVSDFEGADRKALEEAHANANQIYKNRKDTELIAQTDAKLFCHGCILM